MTLLKQAIFCAAVAMMLASPASTQDVLGTGALDMGMLTRNNAETSAIHAQSKARSNRPRQARPTKASDGADRTCRELPEYRRVLGSDDSRVRRLTVMGRQLGYR